MSRLEKQRSVSNNLDREIEAKKAMVEAFQTSVKISDTSVRPADLKHFK